MSRLMVVSIAAVLATAPQVAQAQAQPASGSHVHYTEASSEQVSATGAIAPRLQNLGTHAFPVSTRNRQAQLYINQGLRLAYAFNHAEARRAFREAARLDPNLAMAYWGQVGLIRFRGHLPKGGYDVPNAQEQQRPAATPAIL